MFFNLRQAYWTLYFCFICVNDVLSDGYHSQNKPRCGVCPTYFQKICGFDFGSNSTFIFDNQCLLDLYNCIHHTQFIVINYDQCLYFGNFAYVHGLKYEDYDYGEDHVQIINSKKNPDLVK